MIRSCAGFCTVRWTLRKQLQEITHQHTYPLPLLLLSLLLALLPVSVAAQPHPTLPCWRSCSCSLHPGGVRLAAGWCARQASPSKPSTSRSVLPNAARRAQTSTHCCQLQGWPMSGWRPFTRSLLQLSRRQAWGEPVLRGHRGRERSRLTAGCGTTPEAATACGFTHQQKTASTEQHNCRATQPPSSSTTPATSRGLPPLPTLCHVPAG